MRLLGAVLAGGESRRFGSDKALALLDGKPLIEHAIAALATQTEAVIVVGREGGIPDRPGPGLGPLGGINAAIHEAAARGFDAVLTCGCDVPALPRGLAELLAGGGYVAEMPVIGLWPATLGDHLDRWLADDNDRSVRGWANAAGLRRMMLGAPVANLNTPDDLAAFTRGPAG
ncbi:molybdenum cofactor guanylyltransferase [Sphingomonas sp. LB-2]|uniref:molybdenum cofactor guanylyltransferase n=1 Tax=Sphingomonas caeni TaxID=2984949 RepID=UPI00222F3E00|nr:molybdenum cofactor guanylyltransferase [Sphingomonas caeni]MCW3848222.1 molybdenum cofactor guanylyltransferase [Sphingomonas caeni]